MEFDRSLMFSNAQAVTVDAPSQDVIDLGPAPGRVVFAAAALSRDVAKSQCIPLSIQIVETFNNLTSLRVLMQTDDNSAFPTPRETIVSTLTLDSLIAGRSLPIAWLPAGLTQRYVRLFYDVTGTPPTVGRITAGIVGAVQTSGVTF